MNETRRQADLIVTGIDWLITVDPDRRIIRDSAIAVVDGEFAAIGKSVEIATAWNSDEMLNGSGMVGTPGFVDNHLHSSFQMARGLADEANAQSFLFDHMYPYEGAMEKDDVYVSSCLTAMEMLRHGVTCFIDPGNYHPDATIEAIGARRQTVPGIRPRRRAGICGARSARHRASAHRSVPQSSSRIFAAPGASPCLCPPLACGTPFETLTWRVSKGVPPHSFVTSSVRGVSGRRRLRCCSLNRNGPAPLC